MKREGPSFTVTHCSWRHCKIVCGNPGRSAAIRRNARAAPYICEVAPAPRALRGTCRPLRPGQPRPAQASPGQRRPAQPSSAQIRPAQTNSTQLRPAHASPGQARHAQASSAQPKPTRASPGQLRPTFMNQNCSVCIKWLLSFVGSWSGAPGGPCGPGHRRIARPSGGQRFYNHGR